MNIAIFHNFMDNIGGAEIVSLTLARAFDASIYTTNISEEHITKMGYADVLPRIHSIGTIPKKAPWRQQLCMWKFRRLSLGKKYDHYIISGDWAMAAAVNHHPNAWYVHSPLHELWQFKDFVKNTMVSPLLRPIYELWVQWNRKLSLRYAEHVDRWFCNSRNTRERVRLYYKKEAEVVYPPVNTQAYRNEESKQYWLSVNRMTPGKRIELQLQAFSLMPEKQLVIVGSYEKGARQFEHYKKFIDEQKPPNVTIRSWVDADELRALYAQSQGVLATAIDEDFGMTVVEAMAAGKPVVATAEGGYTETLLPDTTGVLITDVTPEKIQDAVHKIDSTLEQNPDAYKQACQQRALDFDTTIFIQSISRILNLPLREELSLPS